MSSSKPETRLTMEAFTLTMSYMMEQKVKMIAFRAEEDDDAMLELMAQMEDRSKSYIIRQSIREAFYKRRLQLNGNAERA